MIGVNDGGILPNPGTRRSGRRSSEGRVEVENHDPHVTPAPIGYLNRRQIAILDYTWSVSEFNPKNW